MTARLLMTVKSHVIFVLTVSPTHMYTLTDTFRDYEGKQTDIGFPMINSRSLLILSGIYSLKQVRIMDFLYAIVKQFSWNF